MTLVEFINSHLYMEMNSSERKYPSALNEKAIEC